jgi:hypothetical protein
MSRHAKFKFPLGGSRIAFAVVLAILVPAAPHTASGKGGTFHLFTFYKAHSESRIGPATPAAAPIFGGCAGRRYRDPITHQCRGPADIR